MTCKMLRVLVGEVPEAGLPPSSDPAQTLVTESSREVFRALRQAARVELVISECAMNLPECGWSDLVEMVAARGIPGELFVVSKEGKTVFRSSIGRRNGFGNSG